ncbi:MAG: DUF4097 family beta strand repeat-containing protein [Acidimicrobiia bacterium]
MSIRSILRIPVLFAALLLTSGAVAARQAATPAPAVERVNVPLSDASQPALVDIALVQGSITVRGTNRHDVGVTAMPEADRGRRRYDASAEGLRRLPQTAGFRISEEGNRVKILSDNPSRSINFEIEVPLRSNLKLSAVNDGEILIENVDGELEVTNVNGGIVMNGVAGSVIAGTTNGTVRATLTRVNAQREMAFTSLNGTVDVTLPPATKANLRMRSNNGDVYSDFDVHLAASTPSVEETRSGNGRYRINRNRAIVGTINGGGPDSELRTFNSNVYVRKGR